MESDSSSAKAPFDTASVAETLTSLETASTLTVCEPRNPTFVIFNEGGVGYSSTILGLNTKEGRAYFDAHGVDNIVALILQQGRDTGLRDCLKDGADLLDGEEVHSGFSDHIETVFCELLDYARDGTDYSDIVKHEVCGIIFASIYGGFTKRFKHAIILHQVYSIILASIYGGFTKSLKHAVVLHVRLHDFAALVLELQNFIFYATTTDDCPQAVALKTVPHRIFSKFGITLSRARAEESVDRFIIDVLCARYGARNFVDAQICLVTTRLRDKAELAFVSYSQDRKGNYRNLKLTLVNLREITWPSLAQIEEIQFKEALTLWFEKDLKKFLARPPSAHPVAYAAITTIIDAIQPHPGTLLTSTDSRKREIPFGTLDPVARLRRHPATPYLWLAVYLAKENESATRFLTGGLVQQIRALYDLNFDDSRLTNDYNVSEQPLILDGQALHDLHRLSYFLLRVISRHAAAFLEGNERVASELQSLKDDLCADIQVWSRMSSERYHFYCPWDETEAERRDRVWLEESKLSAEM